MALILFTNVLFLSPIMLSTGLVFPSITFFAHGKQYVAKQLVGIHRWFRVSGIGR